MSRSGYSEDCYGWSLICWRGAVASAINGRRGQAFLRELLAVLDAMPEKKLIEGELITPAGEVCAIGSVLVKRGLDTTDIDVYDAKTIAGVAGISEALVKEIEYINDGCLWGADTSKEKRWQIVRNWVLHQIKAPVES